MMRELVKATVAFLALPGIVAFAVPLLLLEPEWLSLPKTSMGLIPLSIGLLLLLWCVREFFVRGKGTLAPWAPPKALVTSGLYRFSRNPMYVAVVLVLVGWAALFRSLPIVAYAGAIAIAFHVRVVFGEEPWLARTHGDAWTAYKRRVPRWFGRF